MLFLGFPTRFRRKMAGFWTCVCIIHAVGKGSSQRQTIYLRKRETALLLIMQITSNSMYTLHTTRNSCQFSQKSCRESTVQVNPGLTYLQTRILVPKSVNSYGFYGRFRLFNLTGWGWGGLTSTQPQPPVEPLKHRYHDTRIILVDEVPGLIRKQKLH